MRTIAISNRTIYTTLLIGVGVVLAYALRDVLVLIFLAVVLAAALNPSITWLSRRGLPRGLAVVLMFLVVATSVTVIVTTFVPVIIDEVNQLVDALPNMLGRFSDSASWSGSIVDQLTTKGAASLPDLFARIGVGIFSSAFGLFTGVLTFITLLLLTFYLTLDERGIQRAITGIAPARHREFVGTIVERIESRLGHWLRGQLFLGLIVGLVSTVGLVILGVPYAFALGLIAGITELIPTVGPYLGMIPAALIGLSVSPATAAWVVGLYWLIQQTENNFLVPRVMSKATGLNPIAVFLGLLIGAQLAGMIGILLSIPTVIIVTAIGESFLLERQGELT